MHIFKRYCHCWALLGLMCCQAGIAQDTGQKCLPGTDCSVEEECPPGATCPPKEKPKLSIKPETIVVTSAFQGGAVTLEPTKTVIDMTAFEATGSVDRIEDVLKNMAGIDIIQGTGGADPQQVVMMRGFDDSRFQIAINGRPITSPTAGSDTFVDWSSLTMGDIERVEIIRGSASARYENSMGGVINIITKKGKKGESLLPTSSADVSYSSFDTFTTRGTISGGVGNLGYLVNFGSRISDGFLRNNYWEGQDYSGRLDYRLPKRASLMVSFKRSDLEHGYPVVNDPNSTLSDYDADYPLLPEDADTIRMGRLLSYPGGKSYKVKKAAHFDLDYEQPFGNTNLSVKFFQTRGAEDSYSYQRSGKKLAQTFSGMGDRKEKTTGGMVDYQMNLWARHSLSVGFSHRRMTVHNTPDNYRIFGGYIEDQYALTNKLTLNLGLRYMHVREFSYAYKDPGSSAPAYRHLFHTKLWLPKFTATYHFNPKTEAFVSVNRDYHLPGC